MMHLYLIRHAQSENNARPREQRVEDPPISQLGREQALSLAEWIPQLNLTRLFTSAFLRTLQTTEHVREATGLTPEVRPELHELGGCVAGHEDNAMIGRPGMTGEQIAAQFPTYQLPAELDGDGWWRSQPYESMEQAERRAEALLQRTRAEFAGTDERVAYVTHADFKRIFLRRFFDGPLDTPWNTSIAHIVLDGNEIRLQNYNLVEHLDNGLLSL